MVALSGPLLLENVAFLTSVLHASMMVPVPALHIAMCVLGPQGQLNFNSSCML